MGCVSLPEFSLANGRRADVIALCPAGRLTIVEIKSSVADFRADRKWPDYRDFCDRFFFAIPETVPESLIPEECGLIVADAFGAAMLRAPADHSLSGARRKAVTLRFAHAAAGLLHALGRSGAGEGWGRCEGRLSPTGFVCRLRHFGARRRREPGTHP